MAEVSELADEPEWMTLAEAARRLGMSTSWIQARVRAGDIEVVRRGRQPGVDWVSVEDMIRKSQVTHRVNDALLRPTDPPRAPRGVDLLDLGFARFGWSDEEIGDRLNVSEIVVAVWRTKGVPNHYLFRLRRLVESSPA